MSFLNRMDPEALAQRSLKLEEAHRAFLADEFPMSIVSVYRATLRDLGIPERDLDPEVNLRVMLKQKT